MVNWRGGGHGVLGGDVGGEQWGAAMGRIAGKLGGGGERWVTRRGEFERGAWGIWGAFRGLWRGLCASLGGSSLLFPPPGRG